MLGSDDKPPACLSAFPNPKSECYDWMTSTGAFQPETAGDIDNRG